MLYELLSGEVDAWEVAPLFTDLLKNTNIQFAKDRVKLLSPFDHLDHMRVKGPGSKCNWGYVHLESGITIEYDCLVLALGAEAKLDVVPGSAEYAIPFSTLEDAYKVDKRSHQVLQSRNVQLFQGYFVSCIKELRSPEDSSIMKENGQAVADNPKTNLVLEIKPVQRDLQSQNLEADLVLWTVGSKPLLPQLGASFRWFTSNSLNVRGQAETDETLCVKGHPQIFAIGDSSALRDSSWKILPATAQVAFQQAGFAGWNLWAAINNRPLLSFRFQNLGEMMTLGRNDSAISPSFIEGPTLEGPIGHTARKLAYLFRLPTDEHRIKVGISWLTKSAN